MKKHNKIFNKLIAVLIIIECILFINFSNIQIVNADEPKNSKAQEEIDKYFKVIATPPNGSAESSGLTDNSLEYGLEGPGVLVKTPLYIQGESKGMYGGYPIKDYGCGPTSCAMVVSALTGQKVTTEQLSAEFARFSTSAGSLPGLFPAVAQRYNLKMKHTKSWSEVESALKSGSLVIENIGPSRYWYVSSGHFIVLKGISPDGKVYVNDPAMRKTSKVLHDVNGTNGVHSVMKNGYYIFSK